MSDPGQPLASQQEEWIIFIASVFLHILCSLSFLLVLFLGQSENNLRWTRCFHVHLAILHFCWSNVNSVSQSIPKFGLLWFLNLQFLPFSSLSPTQTCLFLTHKWHFRFQPVTIKLPVFSQIPRDPLQCGVPKNPSVYILPEPRETSISVCASEYSFLNKVLFPFSLLQISTHSKKSYA